MSERSHINQKFERMFPNANNPDFKPDLSIPEPMSDKTTQKLGALPLSQDHICFDKGHSMYPVFTFHNLLSSYGQNKCTRCGYEEDWQYDHPGSNPMYINS